MREILFRGKKIDNGEWVYGYFFTKVQFPKLATEREYYYIKPFGGDSNSWSNFEIDPATVGQYTGLTDKNGKRIFEGDIVEGIDFSVDDDGYGMVNWDDGGFLVSNGFLCGSFVENYNGRDFEVIGNIHDNPELMEGE